MDNAIKIPTMSTMGFVSDTNTKFDFLLSHFFLSDYNQTYLYKGYVTSLPKILETDANNVDNIIGNIRQKLKTYLERYFVYVDVDVSNNTAIKDDSSNVSLAINIKLNDYGQNYNFERLLQTKNSKAEFITKINNYGP